VFGGRVVCDDLIVNEVEFEEVFEITERTGVNIMESVVFEIQLVTSLKALRPSAPTDCVALYFMRSIANGRQVVQRTGRN
jgi:hypothetical protein